VRVGSPVAALRVSAAALTASSDAEASTTPWRKPSRLVGGGVCWEILAAVAWVGEDCAEGRDDACSSRVASPSTPI
jgi:hypothetical protein